MEENLLKKETDCSEFVYLIWKYLKDLYFMLCGELNRLKGFRSNIRRKLLTCFTNSLFKIYNNLSCGETGPEIYNTIQGQIQDLVKGAPKFFQPIFANSAQWSHVNKVSPYWLGSRAHLRTLEALGFFITEYAFSPFWGTFLYYF